MALVCPYEGRKLACDRIVGKKNNGQASSGYLLLRLFQNDYTPLVSSVYANFTECTFSGYTAKELTPAGWSAASTNGSGNAMTNYTPQTFSHDGGGTANTAYGYYVTTHTDLGANYVLFAERFASAVSLTGIGEQVGFSLRFNTADLGSGLTTPNEGELRLVDRLTGKVNSQSNLSLRLFRNDVTLAETLTLADFTTANFSGYSDATLTYTSWNLAVLNVNNRGMSDYNAVTTFTHNGGGTNNTVYGYVVYEGSVALWCEKFATARAITSDDPYYYLQARFELGS